MTSVVLAGGGTAGHTSPMIATANAIRKLDPEVALRCIGTAKGLETRVVPAAGLDLDLIIPVPLPRRVNLDLARLPFRLGKSVAQSRKILREANADVVVGFGGYVSIPVYLAARSMRIPVVIHEANLLPGIANRIGAKFAEFVATTFKITELPNAECIGMPMADSIVAAEHDPDETRRSFGLPVAKPVLLVSGGSQGARSINNALEEAVPELLAAGVSVLHVLGPKNFADHQLQRHDSGACYVPLAFVEDMATAYAAADLMLARAGAATVMETAVSGLPVVFVPLPWGNGEQGRNASELVAAEAGVLLSEAELTASRLLEVVLPRITDRELLGQMGKTASAQYPADAAQVLAKRVLEVVQGRKAK